MPEEIEKRGDEGGDVGPGGGPEDFLADLRAPLMAGTARPARRPMMEMTTSNSTSMKAPPREARAFLEDGRWEMEDGVFGR